MSKICTQCQKTLPLDKFYGQVQKSIATDKRWKYKDSMCKTCRGNYTTNRRRLVKIQAIEYLGGKCQDCGVVDDPCVYDFHHLDSTLKDFSISDKNKKFETIKQELDKCVLLCSNCHRKRHT